MTKLSELGDGPKRFALKNERTLEEQIAALNEEERKCFDTLKTEWESYVAGNKQGKEMFDDAMILRFARNSPGKTKFNPKTAMKVMKKFDRRYSELTAEQLEDQLKTATLFPIPGLKTKEGGHATFYMRPSRYFPSKTSVPKIIDNLAYAMNHLVEAEKECTEGIAFMAYMNDWSISNFSVNYCLQFMQMLQGRIPVRVRLFLIVNPPGWFGKIWAIMKPMLAADFRKKVHMIMEDKLPEFFEEGYAKYLPDDCAGGKVSTQQLADDFVSYRKALEESKK